MRSRTERTCEDCPLGEEAKKVCGFGEVDRPKLMFVAEAPGETEKRLGKPLVGKSGKLLRRVLADLGVEEESFFYSNTCLCKRSGPIIAPTAKMVAACYEGLMEEIRAVHPRLVVALGNHAAKAIGQYTRGVQSVRGQYRELELGSFRVGVLPTYHPAAILRNPDLFRDFVTDLERAVRIGVKGEPATVAPPVENYRVIEKKADLNEVLDELEAAGVVALDLETDGLDPFSGTILDVGLCWKEGYGVSIDWKLVAEVTSCKERLRTSLERLPIVMQEARFDTPWLWQNHIRPNLKFDTAIAHWLLDERQNIHDLGQMSTRYFSAPDYKGRFRRKHGLGAWIADEEQFGDIFSKIPSTERRIYNATDADYTLRLALLFKPMLKEQGLLRLNRFLVQGTLFYTEMWWDGMDIDWDVVTEMEKQLQDKIVEAARVLEDMAPKGLNIRSSKQLAAYFFDELKLSPFGGREMLDEESIPQEVISAGIREVTDPAARAFWQNTRPVQSATFDEDVEVLYGGLKPRSTSKFMLYYLAQQHEFPKALINYREAKKQLSLWVNDLKSNRWPDDKVRPTYKLNATVNGRFTSKKPSVHTLPPVMYDAFVAQQGYVIVHADYSQADMRVLAQFSKDERYAEWLKSDPHTELIKAIGKLSDEDLVNMPKAELRSRRLGAKAVNFGLPYGRGAESLAPQMGITIDEAREWAKVYWSRLPKLHLYVKNGLKRVIANNQEIVSPFGNKRRLPIIVDRKHASSANRLATNMPVMATVNYLTMLAHMKSVRALRKAGIDTKIHAQVHDSMNVVVPRSRVDEAVAIISDVMKRVPEAIDFDLDFCPFPSEITAGRSWGNQMKVHDGTKQIPFKEPT